MPFSLLDLPNELLRDILSVTANADLDNCSLTCKTIYNNHVLAKHRERKKLYASMFSTVSTLAVVTNLEFYLQILVVYGCLQPDYSKLLHEANRVAILKS